MTDLGDYQLERSGEALFTPPPARSTSYGVWATAVVAAIAVAGGIWYFTSRRQPSPQAVNVPSAPQAAVPERPQGPLVKAADIDLPPLRADRPDRE